MSWVQIQQKEMASGKNTLNINKLKSVNFFLNFHIDTRKIELYSWPWTERRSLATVPSSCHLPYYYHSGRGTGKTAADIWRNFQKS